MNICELFLSVEGEGKRTGIPAVFVRKSLCNMRPYCSYCDTAYSFKENPDNETSVPALMTKLYEVAGGVKTGCKRVTFTGGEPLYFKDEKDKIETEDLLNTLTYNGFEVNVETNGSIDLEPWADIVRRHGFFTMDWKSISSGASKNMKVSNLNVLDEEDVLKFVVGTQEDLDQMKSVLNLYDIKSQVYVSPVFGKINPQDIVSYVLENRLYDVKVQLQLHKYIWDKDKRGV